MDLVSEYFKFKKSYMREYCTSLMGSCFNDALRDEYLENGAKIVNNTKMRQVFKRKWRKIRKNKKNAPK